MGRWAANEADGDDDGAKLNHCCVCLHQAVDTWALLGKPPVWICSLLIFAITLPIALCQPLFEPYLTASPYNLTPGGVGIVFGLIALVDTVSAVLTGGTSLLVGQLELIVISLLLLIGGCFVIALGPKARAIQGIDLRHARGRRKMALCP